MRLEEGAELNQMVLYKDVLLSQFCLALFEVFLLFAEFFLLIFEGLLHLVHGAAFFKKARRW
jgi:hypothetical protein